MAPTTPPLINPSLRTNGGDDGAAGALASATSAEKKQGSRAPRGPKVLNNFGSFPARRNPARVVRINGGVAEAEVAGGSPRKKHHGSSPRMKPHGKETFLLRLDRAKATAEHDSRTEPIELKDDPDDRTNGGRPTNGLPKTKKAHPVTQEDNGVDDLDSEEEEADSEDNVGLKDGVAVRNRLALTGPSATAARTSEPTAAAPRIPSLRRPTTSTTTTRSLTPLATKQRVSPSRPPSWGQARRRCE